MREILDLRGQRDVLKRRLARVENDLSYAEGAVMTALDSGHEIQSVAFDLALKTSERRYPAWKECFVALAGKEAADAVLAETTATIYRQLVIRSRGAS